MGGSWEEMAQEPRESGREEALEWVDWDGDGVLLNNLSESEMVKVRAHPLMKLYVREEGVEEAEGEGMRSEMGVAVKMDEKEREGRCADKTKAKIR